VCLLLSSSSEELKLAAAADRRHLDGGMDASVALCLTRVQEGVLPLHISRSPLQKYRTDEAQRSEFFGAKVSVGTVPVFLSGAGLTFPLRTLRTNVFWRCVCTGQSQEWLELQQSQIVKALL
jgi:hypothetical protein